MWCKVIESRWHCRTFFVLALYIFALTGYGFENDILSRNEKIKIEADYILQCQYLNPGHAAHGAINTIYGKPTWIVPEQNALAILGLIAAAETLHDSNYLHQAHTAADFLIRAQDHNDGAWRDLYSFAVVTDSNKSVRQTAKVMIALYKLGFVPERYDNMKLAAHFILTCQSPGLKIGADDGLLCEGKDNRGEFKPWRWTHDNAFGYWALKAAQEWAAVKNDSSLYFQCAQGANDLLTAINEILYDSTTGLWQIAVDEVDAALANPHLNCLDANADIYPSWIQYAPQLLDLPANGVNTLAVGESIRTIYSADDSIRPGCLGYDCQNGDLKLRRYPRNAFLTALSWFDTGHLTLAKAAIDWAENSSFWQINPDLNGVIGGWIHWSEVKPEPSQSCDWWLRLVDTSFYSIAGWLGGYDFSCAESEKNKFSALGRGYSLK